ncbi:TetR/AcrR family transcriptional regulator [Radiobacillus kanasensis]|uniref:TetR/AcrR family transcriptional regulator n=1 Tax=Radiobacillus kanasensis TaxID=2844358 RepID=UPI001E4A256C|nr:TetR/AcrR family transcriptional regulator [Radiobacillus kanasensis]UFU00633.1 TetR/AcrR family transcriptional regulator [Radiobacillus kanasensis]
MNEKKEKIINTAIDLFAEKGFFTTSIQEIAEKSEVSKGAFYLHFHSKDELLLEIFKYYYELINSKVVEAVDDTLSPKENLVRQLEVQYREILKHKSFIMTQLREQAITLNKDLYDFLRYMELEVHKWYEEVLIAIYGEKLDPYLADVVFLFEGMKSSFFQVLIKGNLELDVHRTARYMVERLDDLVVQMLRKNVQPLITKEQMKKSFESIASPNEQIMEEVKHEIMIMEKVISDLDVSKGRREELQGVIDFLHSEVKRETPKKFVIQGMLANLKGIPELDKHRKWISQKLDVRLL